MLRNVIRKSPKASVRRCPFRSSSLALADNANRIPHQPLTPVAQYAVSFSRSSRPFAARWMSSSKDDDEAPNEAVVETVAAPSLVYESPLSTMVVRLRTVSLVTAFAGVTGVPCMIAIKGVVPEAGMLAIAMTFVAGSSGSTAAIHYVFHPYIMSIESIPIRKCSTKPKESEDGSSRVAEDSSPPEIDLKEGNVLLKAVTRSLFLRQVDVIFDPEIDVVPYQGYRPLCNFVAKGVPLYVHPEYVYDNKLRKAMQLDDSKTDALPEKENPDDLL